MQLALEEARDTREHGTNGNGQAKLTTTILTSPRMRSFLTAFGLPRVF